MAWHPFRNVGLKVVALGLGSLLWLVVSGQQVERSVRVPLEYRKRPPTLEITGDPPETVEVWVRGSSSQISRLGLGDVVAFVDLTGAKPGQRLFPLQVDQGFGIEVTRKDPPDVTLSLETSASANVPIVPAIDGQPAAGFVVQSTTVDPKVVEIVGPFSAIREVKSAITDRISIEGLRNSVTEVVNVGVTDANLRLRQPVSARVTITIARR
jgi:YbbR domain-containing protein